MPARLRPLFALAILFSLAPIDALAVEIAAERNDRGVAVTIDGQPFTEYLVRSGTKPILWPIIGPTGKPMTRDYPMRDNPGEKRDHPHQRSLWFTHGEVNGVNFWTEEPGKTGRIEHVKFVKVAGGKPAVIVTENHWLAPDGKIICKDQRALHFDADANARWIDVDVALKATHGDVTFGDTKEGTFGIRVAEHISVDADRGGRIVNSHQQVDDAAWGKKASWVDYYAPLDGQTTGIAVLNHPSSFRYPTFWHVRKYGLFAANPFGLHDFTRAKAGNGAYTLANGKSLSFRYRILLHRGNEEDGKVAEAFAAYAKETR